MEAKSTKSKSRCKHLIFDFTTLWRAHGLQNGNSPSVPRRLWWVNELDVPERGLKARHMTAQGNALGESIQFPSP
jgi:hypothetical protein